MRAIVALGYEAVCALVPYAIASGVNAHRSHVSAHRKQTSASKRPSMWAHRLAVTLFGICLFSILWICGVGTFADLWRGTSLRTMLNINLVPFDAYLNWTTWALNVVLFVPLGLLLPCCWEGFDRIGHAALFGFLFSLAIELAAPELPRHGHRRPHRQYPGRCRRLPHLSRSQGCLPEMVGKAPGTSDARAPRQCCQGCGSALPGSLFPLCLEAACRDGHRELPRQALSMKKEGGA